MASTRILWTNWVTSFFSNTGSLEKVSFDFSKKIFFIAAEMAKASVNELSPSPE
jgi:hypothetical protein